MEEQEKQQLQKAQEWVEKQLEKVAEWLEKGLITKEEYTEQKKKILQHQLTAASGDGKTTAAGGAEFDWEAFASDFRQPFRDAFKSFRSSEDSWLANKDKALAEQQKHWPLLGRPFPSTSSSIYKPALEFGGDMKWEPPPSQSTIYSVAATDQPGITARVTSDTLFDIPAKSDPSNAIFLLLQVRGAGKTSALFELARQRYVLYIDFTSTPFSGEGSRTMKVGGLLQRLKQLQQVSPNDLAGNFDSATKLFRYHLFAVLLFFQFWLDEFSEFGPEVFLRFSENGGALTVDGMFRTLLKFSLASIEDYLVLKFLPRLQQLREMPVVAYDEVSTFCSKKSSPGGAIFRHRNEADEGDGEPRLVFHPFADFAVGIRGLQLPVVLAGTNLSMSLLMEDGSSAFKSGEITFLKPLYPTHATAVKAILQSYFPSLTVSDEIAGRWAGRARVLFDILIQNLINGSKRKDDPVDLQSFFEQQEPGWYVQAVNLLRSYIQEYYRNHKTILEDIFYCCVIREVADRPFTPRKYTECATLMDRGLFFLPTEFNQGAIHFRIEEEAAVDALRSFFKDFSPVIQRLEDNLFRKAFGIGEYLERLVGVSLLSAAAENKKEVESIPFFKRFCDQDPRLRSYGFYCKFIATPKVSDSTSFIKWLKHPDPKVMMIPPTAAGPDLALFLELLPQHTPSPELPRYRLVLLQCKNWKENLTGSNLVHAIRTVLPWCMYGIEKQNKSMTVDKRRFKEMLARVNDVSEANRSAWTKFLDLVRSNINEADDGVAEEEITNSQKGKECPTLPEQKKETRLTTEDKDEREEKEKGEVEEIKKSQKLEWPTGPEQKKETQRNTVDEREAGNSTKRGDEDEDEEEENEIEEEEEDKKNKGFVPQWRTSDCLCIIVAKKVAEMPMCPVENACYFTTYTVPEDHLISMIIRKGELATATRRCGYCHLYWHDTRTCLRKRLDKQEQQKAKSEKRKVKAKAKAPPAKKQRTNKHSRGKVKEDEEAEERTLDKRERGKAKATAPLKAPPAKKQRTKTKGKKKGK